MKEYLKIIKEENSVFEESFKNTIFSQNIPLKDEIIKFLFGKSKRLRPNFIILFSKILQINSKKVYDFAILSELAHNASLIHDDVIDEDEKRRGDLTFEKKFGTKVAVLEGDLLLSIFLEELSNQDIEVIKIYTKNIKKIITGEISQLLLKDIIPSEDEYLKKTFSKTANLFLAGIEALFTLKELDLKTKNAILECVKNFALAFQIKNDIDNLKNNGSDFKNGNYTLPVIYLRQEQDTDEINLGFIEKYINKAQNKVFEIKEKSIIALDLIENSSYKKALIALIEDTLRG